MRTLIERAWDDLDHAVEATCTDIPLTFDGTSVILDLSDASYKELEQLLAPYLKAGTHKGRAASPAANTIKRNKAMRAWGDANGLGLGVGYTHGEGKSEGVYYYRVRLQNAYAEHEKQQARR